VQKTIVLAVKKFFPLSIFWVLFAFKGYYFATLIINKMNANIYPYLLIYLINAQGNFELLENPCFSICFFSFYDRIQITGNGFRKPHHGGVGDSSFLNFTN
jgi:hypothetical protein